MEHVLAGRRVLVMGGAVGIGAAVVDLFGRAGAAVVAADVNTAALDAIVERVRGAGGDVSAVRANVRDVGDLEAAIDATYERLGGCDVLVNIPGGMTVDWGRLDRWSDRSWEEIFAQNVGYVVSLCRMLLRRFVEDGTRGSIINMASVAAFVGAPGNSGYGAAKAAIVSLTRTLAVEYGHHGIRVNAIAPGVVRNDSQTRPRDDQIENMPLKVEILPIDIANAALFLASDLARCITGQVLTVDGGLLAKPVTVLPDWTR